MDRTEQHNTRLGKVLTFPRDKKPVECEDDPFGFNAVVVYGGDSYALNRCVPFRTAVNRAQNLRLIAYNNERAAAEAEDASEFRHPVPEVSNGHNREQPNAVSCPVWPESTDADNRRNRLTFTDGGSPEAMVFGGMRRYKSPQMESLAPLEEEGWDKRPSPKKKGGKKGGKKSRRKHRR